MAFTSTYANQQSAYVGQEPRDIKALSQQDIDSILAGKGMGFAKAVEMNGYPDPAHVLELADKLELARMIAKASTAFESIASGACALSGHKTALRTS